MKYAIFIDIDGTLKNDNGEISDRCKKIIKNIVSKGHMVILCTARPRYQAQLISEEVGASNYILSSNGAELYDYLNNKILFSNYINNNIVIKILNKVIKNKLRATLAINECEYIIGEKYGEYQKKLPFNFNDFDGLNLVKQFMIIDNTDNKIDKMRNIVNKYKDIEITNKHTIEETQGKWFSFVEKNTSKGNGIKKFCKMLSLSKKNVISIGNDYNDISMFESSGIRVAVKNSTDDILRLADVITDSNNDDGVAKILEKFYNSFLSNS